MNLASLAYLLHCIAPVSFTVPFNVRATTSHSNTANLLSESGLNPYDARIECDRERDGPLCYRQMGWIETYLNDPEVKAALGVNPQRNFESCNMAVNQAFMLQGDSMHNTPLLLKEMINDGVRLLVYAGNAGEVIIL